MGAEARTARGMAKADREVIVEDGFTYKRRKSAAVPHHEVRAARGGAGGPRASAGGPHHQPSGARLSSGHHHYPRGGAASISQRRGQYQGQHDATDLPADYPGLHIHERIPTDLPEDERFQMLVAEICEAECGVERERLMREHGAVEGARMAKALESALSEFQYKVEELIVRGELMFDGSSGTALRQVRDAKQEAMMAVVTKLEDESAQWAALEQATAAASTATANGSGEQEDNALTVARRDAEEAVEAVRSMLAAEAAVAGTSSRAAALGGEEQHVVAAPGEVAASVEEAQRRMAMQAEGLNALVEGVEALCVRAERAVEVFSKALAENDFKGLPHVDSPQALLKTLVAAGKK